MNDLPEHARHALNAFKATEAGASEAVRARTWAAIESRAGTGDLGPLLAAEEVPAAASGVASWSPLLKGVAIGILATSVVVGAWALGRNTAGSEAAPPPTPGTSAPFEPAEPRPPETETEASPVASAAIPEREPESVAVPSEQEPVIDEPSAPVVAKPHPAATSRRAATPRPAAKEPAPPPESTQALTPGEDPLQAELALMGKARAALKADQHGNAVTLLDEHAKRFPKGTFARERDLSRIRALCELGKETRAKKIGRRYLEDEGSVMATKVQATCAGE